MWTWLKGKKTYIISGLAIIWALYNWQKGLIDPSIAQQTIFGALTAAGLRHGIDGVK